MKVLKVCKGRGGCGKKPAIWIDGGMHAREWISPASVTYIVKKLLDDDKSKFTNRNLVENLDWYFLAVANPDGYKWSRTEDRLWRKNRLENIFVLKITCKLISEKCATLDNSSFFYVFIMSIILLEEKHQSKHASALTLTEILISIGTILEELVLLAVVDIIEAINHFQNQSPKISRHLSGKGCST